MKYILMCFSLMFIVGCTPSFKLYDKVDIVGGFFEGYSGTVTDIGIKWILPCQANVFVEFIDEVHKLHTELISVCDLKKKK